jgi:hypothetical protein
MSKNDDVFYNAGLYPIQSESKGSKEIRKKLIGGKFKNYLHTKDERVFYVPGSMQMKFQNLSGGRFSCEILWLDLKTKKELIRICKFECDVDGMAVLDSDDLVWPFILDLEVE